MTQDWINGVPVQTDSTNFEWVGGLPNVITEPPAAPAVGTNMKINIGDTFKDVSEIKINIGDTWKTVSNVYINIGDTWKSVF